MLAIKRGDIVALFKGKYYDLLLGVAVSVSDHRVRVDFGTGVCPPYRRSDGLSLHSGRGAADYRIRPLDAEVRKDILAVGFAYGGCSRRQLEKMEARARELRAAMMESAG